MKKIAPLMTYQVPLLKPAHPRLRFWPWIVLALTYLAMAVWASAVFAQTPDATTMNRIAGALQAQRNSAMDQSAGLQAKVDVLSDELEKARARIKELEPKPEAKTEKPKE